MYLATSHLVILSTTYSVALFIKIIKPNSLTIITSAAWATTSEQVVGGTVLKRVFD